MAERNIIRAGTRNVLYRIVRTYPVSGRKGLYVSPRFTVGIQDMDDAEAQPLLDTLFAYQTAPGNVYRHKWILGDFVLWDNCSVNHQACGGYAMDDIRLLHRTSTRGDQPFA
jgi:taurine dioxygenase